MLCAWQFYLLRFNLFYIKIPFYSTHMNIRFNLCIFWNFYNNTSVHIIYSRIIARLHFQNQFLLFNLVFRSSYIISILFSAIYTKICYIGISYIYRGESVIMFTRIRVWNQLYNLTCKLG